MKHFISTLFFIIGLSWGSLASAQSVFVQIEAHSNLPDAQTAARSFAGRLPDVNGFRFSTGWYVIALGPYDLNTAVAQINSLKASRVIPADSYLVDRNAYSNQFYPVGVDSLAAAPLTTPTQPVETAALIGAISEASPNAQPHPIFPWKKKKQRLSVIAS